MKIASIRQELHSYLEVADDKKVKAIYASVKKEIQESAVVYSDELKSELDSRYAAYKSGKAKPVTAQQSKRRVAKLLKSAESRSVMLKEI
jgi:putative addiction module component (TIGR02574 family)